VIGRNKGRIFGRKINNSAKRKWNKKDYLRIGKKK